MKKFKTLALLTLSVGFLSLPSHADLFGALNKASDTINKVNSTAQATSDNLQAAQNGVNALKTGAAKEALMSTLSSRLSKGETTQSELIALLGEPVKSKVKGKAKTLTYKIAGVAEHLETVELIANAAGIQTPMLSGTLDLVLRDDLLQSYDVNNFNIQ